MGMRKFADYCPESRVPNVDLSDRGPPAPAPVLAIVGVCHWIAILVEEYRVSFSIMTVSMKHWKLYSFPACNAIERLD